MYQHRLDEEASKQIRNHHDAVQGICQEALDGDISKDEFIARVVEEVYAAFLLMYLLGGGSYADAENAELREQMRLAYNSVVLLADDIYEGRYSENDDQTEDEGNDKLWRRLSLWTFTLGAVYAIGQLYPKPGPDFSEPRYVWRRGSTKEPCSTCLSLDGVIMTASEWRISGYRPQGSSLECGGWNCQCYWEEVFDEQP
jgi:hypothetical protein